MPTKKIVKVEPAKAEAEPKESKPAPPAAIPAEKDYDPAKHANHSHLNP